jgi:hypothetical protein
MQGSYNHTKELSSDLLRLPIQGWLAFPDNLAKFLPITDAQMTNQIYSKKKEPTMRESQST